PRDSNGSPVHAFRMTSMASSSSTPRSLRSMPAISTSCLAYPAPATMLTRPRLTSSTTAICSASRAGSLSGDSPAAMVIGMRRVLLPVEVLPLRHPHLHELQHVRREGTVLPLPRVHLERQVVRGRGGGVPFPEPRRRRHPEPGRWPPVPFAVALVEQPHLSR